MAGKSLEQTGIKIGIILLVMGSVFYAITQNNNIFIFNAGLMILILCTIAIKNYLTKIRTRIIVNLLDRKEFIIRLMNATEDIGYHPQSESENMLAFEPDGQDGMSENAIFIRIGDRKAEITGPVWITYKLRKRMEFLFENVLLPG